MISCNTSYKNVCVLDYTRQKPILRADLGFKSVFKCDNKLKLKYQDNAVCSAKFRTLELLKEHCERSHNGKLRYKEVVVDGSYIDERIKQCRTKVVVFSHSDPLQLEAGLVCDHKKILSNSCYIRTCPKCERTRKSRYARTYARVLSGFNRISLLTLTYRGHYDLDPEIKSEFERGVKRFVDRLKYRFKGYRFQYVRVLETKCKGDGYYYHFHFLIDMPYVHQTILSDMWRECSGNESYIVDIRHVGNRWGKEQKLGYICKYLAKPHELNNDDYARYVYRSRFVETRVSTSLVSIRNSRGKNEFCTCEKCGYLLRYTETLDLKVDPGGGT